MCMILSPPIQIYLIYIHVLYYCYHQILYNILIENKGVTQIAGTQTLLEAASVPIRDLKLIVNAMFIMCIIDTK